MSRLTESRPDEHTNAENLKTEECSTESRRMAKGPLLQLRSPAKGGVQDLQEQLVARWHQLVLLKIRIGSIHHTDIFRQQSLGRNGSNQRMKHKCLTLAAPPEWSIHYVFWDYLNKMDRKSIYPLCVYLKIVVAVLQVWAEGGQQLDGKGNNVRHASLL